MRPMLALLVLLLAPGPATAADTEAEIEYLIQTVADSGCIFNRNGSDHDSAAAADHMRRKYGHGKRYVNSAEQFIDRLATESSWTGRPYTITCDGVTEPSGEWLHRALQEHRAGS